MATRPDENRLLITAVNKVNYKTLTGFFTKEQKIIQQIMEQFDSIWMGARCDQCGRREHCAEGGVD